MIVVSGALVLLALIFLIVGLLGDGLTMIWLSIGTSVVAGVFLLLGALQRRGTPATAADAGGTTGTDMLERVTAVSVKPRETEAAPPAAEAAPAMSEGEVSVVPGRPRYHVESCRFLAGRPDVETIPVEKARSDGFTACGVCKPDAALSAAAAAPEPEPEAEPEMAEEPAEEVAEAPAPAKKAPAKRTARTAAASGSSSATTTAMETPAKATKAAKPAKKAAAAKSTSGAQVVVIPDRGKFHTETCRFVKDVPGTVTLTKPAAKRQGYAPCGVCKP